MSIYLLSPTQKEGTIHLPMIQFDLCDVKVDLTHIDLLLFTSAQGVKSVDKLTGAWKALPSLSIGTATQYTITDLGGKVVYSAKKFYADQLAKDIILKYRDKKILYIRPKIVSFDIKGYLANKGMVLEEAIVYETSCVTYDLVHKPLEGAVIIFTSPSTITCFFKNFDWDESYTAVVIGESTKKNTYPPISQHIWPINRQLKVVLKKQKGY
jgi:uroporphyrinogen-III synthase